MVIEREINTSNELRALKASLEKNQGELENKLGILAMLEKQLDNIEEKCRFLKDTNREQEMNLQRERA